VIKKLNEVVWQPAMLITLFAYIWRIKTKLSCTIVDTILSNVFLENTKNKFDIVELIMNDASNYTFSNWWIWRQWLAQISKDDIRTAMVLFLRFSSFISKDLKSYMVDWSTSDFKNTDLIVAFLVSTYKGFIDDNDKVYKLIWKSIMIDWHLDSKLKKAKNIDSKSKLAFIKKYLWDEWKTAISTYFKESRKEESSSTSEIET
jgi:hypothetical protein